MVNVIDKERQGLDPALQGLLDESELTAGDFIYCVNCSHILGRASDATIVNGSHQHLCTNPHGIDFDVRCYRQALGCTISGESIAADSWFEHYRWRFATCTGCHTHLGWLFEAAGGDTGAAYFYGLIAERIQIEASDEH